MINAEPDKKEYRRLTTPRAASIAGVLFGLLFATSLALLRSSMPENLIGDNAWVDQTGQQIKIALALMPFAGIAFLWFIGVVRDLLGDFEDRFFSTVFLGSGLLFLGMVFVAMAIGGGILAVAQVEGADFPKDEIIFFARAFMFQVSNVYALRMAGVFMISLGTIWLRTGLLPRWLALVTFLLALVLLLVINFNLWITLVFPIWVLLISAFKLISDSRNQG
jgi:hypothetical protein